MAQSPEQIGAINGTTTSFEIVGNLAEKTLEKGVETAAEIIKSLFGDKGKLYEDHKIPEEATVDDIDLFNKGTIHIPYSNRFLFEKALADSGIRFTRENVTDKKMGYQGYVFENDNDKKIAMDIIRKYNRYDIPRYTIMIEDPEISTKEIEKEMQIFQGCRCKEMFELDCITADRICRELQAKNIYHVLEFHENGEGYGVGTYSIKVKEADFHDLEQAWKNTELFFHTKEGEWEKTRIMAKQSVNSCILNIIEGKNVDISKSTENIESDSRLFDYVITDSENPNYIIEVTRESEQNKDEQRFTGYELIKGENGKMEKLELYSFVLNDELRSDDTYMQKFKNFMDVTVNVQFGTPVVFEKKDYEQASEERIMYAGLLTEKSLDMELKLNTAMYESRQQEIQQEQERYTNTKDVVSHKYDKEKDPFAVYAIEQTQTVESKEMQIAPVGSLQIVNKGLTEETIERGEDAGVEQPFKVKEDILYTNVYIKDARGRYNIEHEKQKMDNLTIDDRNKNGVRDSLEAEWDQNGNGILDSKEAPFLETYDDGPAHDDDEN